jgi:hypothetical protein
VAVGCCGPTCPFSKVQRARVHLAGADYSALGLALDLSLCLQSAFPTRQQFGQSAGRVRQHTIAHLVGLYLLFLSLTESLTVPAHSYDVWLAAILHAA